MFTNYPKMILQLDTICALSTPQGVGAIGVIRVSGVDTFPILNKIFKGKDLTKVDSHTIHFGTIRDNEKIIDEVLVAVFKTPKSFTKEDVAEISCHGSEYIIRYILKLLIQHGCRMANPGEFTQRAFMNGQFDLVQAEAVADLIAADSEAAHRTALTQMRGGFSKKIAVLREELIHFASLVELELDFGEEDVEFADRDDLKALIHKLKSQLEPLIASFDAGNVIKEGVPVAIIGPPNAGKSTLLNNLLNEEKAIVTAIAGTTRDVIEDIMFIDGIKFRFIDTAGIRETEDLVESMGIERSLNAMLNADIVLLLLDSDQPHLVLPDGFDEQKVIWVRNKIDLKGTDYTYSKPIENEVQISAKLGIGIEDLKNTIVAKAKTQRQADTMLTNLRHYEHLVKANEALAEVLNGLAIGITGDFLAQDIRLSLHHLGEITGQITTDDLLDNIFSKFCIGK